MRHRKARKVVKIILGVLLVIALANTAYWLYFTKVKFAKFSEASNGTEGKNYEKNPDYYLCTVEPEGIWGYHCELEVIEEVQVDGNTNKKKNTSVTLIIYPQIFGGYKTQCYIDDNDTGELKSLYHDVSLLLELDENMKLKTGNESAYTKYYDKIYEAYSVAHDVYGIYTLPSKK